MGGRRSRRQLPTCPRCPSPECGCCGSGGEGGGSWRLGRCRERRVAKRVRWWRGESCSSADRSSEALRIGQPERLDLASSGLDCVANSSSHYRGRRNANSSRTFCSGASRLVARNSHGRASGRESSFANLLNRPCHARCGELVLNGSREAPTENPNRIECWAWSSCSHSACSQAPAGDSGFGRRALGLTALAVRPGSRARSRGSRSFGPVRTRGSRGNTWCWAGRSAGRREFSRHVRAATMWRSARGVEESE